MTDAPEYADPDRYIELAGFTGEWRDLFWNHDFLSLMARRWRLAEVRDALDVGCGAGHWGRALIKHLPAAARVTGVDLEARFCELARHEAAARGLDERLDYLQGGVEALPFPADSFDLVTCQTLLIHVADVEAALTEMFARHDQRFADVRKAMVESLGRIHEALDERQRETLAAMLERGRPFGRGFGPYRGGDGG